MLEDRSKEYFSIGIDTAVHIQTFRLIYVYNPKTFPHYGRH